MCVLIFIIFFNNWSVMISVGLLETNVWIKSLHSKWLMKNFVHSIQLYIILLSIYFLGGRGKVCVLVCSVNWSVFQLFCGLWASIHPHRSSTFTTSQRFCYLVKPHSSLSLIHIDVRDRESEILYILHVLSYSIYHWEFIWPLEKSTYQIR